VVEVRVDYRLKACAIVAGGWSARPHEIGCLNMMAKSRFMDRICVNDAFRYVSDISCVVTMDRKWLENRYDEVHGKGLQIFYRSCTLKGPIAGRLDRYKHVGFHNNNSPGPMMGQTVPFTLNGNNSGTCAMNLAFIRGYHSVYLFGFDMQKGPNGENHFYPDYEWNKNATKPDTLVRWAGSFREVADQFTQRDIKVFNVSNRSLIRDFPVISFNEFTRRFS
jgi:hypothetical protein